MYKRHFSVKYSRGFYVTRVSLFNLNKKKLFNCEQLVKTMDNETRKRLEYEEQFYGMSSRFFIDSFKNFIDQELNSNIVILADNFKSKIIDQTENVEKFEKGLKKMIDELTTEYGNALKDVFREKETAVENILNIPQNILLKEDIAIANSINGDVENIKADIDDLKEIYQSLLFLKNVLLEELEEADSAIILMESFISDDNVIFDVLPTNKMYKLSKQNRILFEDFK